MKTFKTLSLVCLLAGLTLTTACKKETETVTVSTDGPIGATTTLKTGSIQRQNAPGTPDTKGTVTLVKDSKGNSFAKMGSDFQSGFATGTVVVSLAKSADEIKNQRTAAFSNVKAIGFVGKNGEQFLKVSGETTGYTHLVLYCETAEVNFGVALLQ